MSLNLQPRSVIAVGVLLPTVASVALGLRFYSRRRLRVFLKEDDWSVLVSCIFVWGLGITNIAGMPYLSSYLGPLMLITFPG